MGFSSSGGPKGLGAITDSNTPLADGNSLISLIAAVGNVRNGVEADRDALAGAKLYAGLLFSYTEKAQVDFYDGSGWRILWEDPAPTNVTTFGAGWAQTSGAQHTPRLIKRGRVVELYGSVTSASGFSYGNILTVPTAFRPANTATRFVGSGVASNGMAFELALTAGVLSVPTGYATGTIPVANAHPLHCSWLVD